MQPYSYIASLEPEYGAKRRGIKTRDFYDLHASLIGRYAEVLAKDVDPSTRADYLAQASHNLMRTIFDYEDDSIIKGEVSPDEYLTGGLEFFRKLYLPGGPLEGIPMQTIWYIQPEGIAKYAPLVHLVLKEPEHFGHLQENVSTSLMSALFRRPSTIKKVSRHLKTIGGKEAVTQFSDVMESLCANTHVYSTSYVAAVGVQSLGGLKWLKDCGANIQLCLDRFLDGIETTTASSKAFAQVFRVSMDCINELESTGAMGSEDAKLKRGALLTGALEVSGRQKRREPELWEPIIKEARVNSIAKPDVRQVLSYAFNTQKEEVDRQYCLSICVGQEAELKRCLKRDYIGEDRYRVVIAAGLESLFKENELLALRGKTFAAELGL